MPTLRLPLDAMEVVADMVVVVDTGARGLLMLKPAPTMADPDTTVVTTGKGLPMPTLRLPLDAMEVVADMVVVVDTGARGLLMLKPAPTVADPDTTAVITGKGLPMPMLRLPLDAMEVVADMVVVGDTGARGLLMLKPAPTMADPDTTAVITGKGLLMPTLRLPLDA